MWVVATTWCSEQLTDGRIHRDMLASFTGHRKPDEVIASLVDAGALYDVGDGFFELHDFLDWNPTRDQVVANRAARQAAGSKGGVASGAARRPEGRDEEKGNDSGRGIEHSRSKCLSKHQATGNERGTNWERPRNENEPDLRSQISDLISTESSPPLSPPEERARDGGGGPRRPIDEIVATELRRHRMTAFVADDSLAMGALVETATRIPTDRIASAIEWAADALETDSVTIGGGQTLTLEATLKKLKSGFKGETTKWRKEPRAPTTADNAAVRAAAAEAARRLNDESGAP